MMERWWKTGVLAIGLALVLGVVLQPRIFGEKAEEAPANLPAASGSAAVSTAGAATDAASVATAVATQDPAAALQARLEANPRDVDAWKTMGDVLLSAREYAGAAEAYAAVIEIDPNSAAGHAGLGDSLLYQGLVRVARAEYRRAIELDPKQPQVHLNLGVTLSHATPADIPGAVVAWKEVLILAPGSELARQAQAYLDTYDAPNPHGTPTVTPTATPATTS